MNPYSHCFLFKSSNGQITEDEAKEHRDLPTSRRYWALEKVEVGELPSLSSEMCSLSAVYDLLALEMNYIYGHKAN